METAEWQGLFSDPIIANSIMDRIAHNAHQIVMTGDSYRNRGKTISKSGKTDKED